MDMNGIDLLVIAERLRAAVAALAQVCDGAKKRDDVGFSASDTSYGRAIAGTPADQWTRQDCIAVSALLGHYRGQLTAYGVDWAGLPNVTESVNREASFKAFKERATEAARQQQRMDYVDGRITRDQVRVAAPYLAWVEKRTVCIESPRDEALIAAIKACPNGRRWNGLARRWEVELSPANAKALQAIFSRFNFLVSGADQATLMAANAQPAAPTAPVLREHIKVEDGKFVLATPYDPQATAAIKEIRGRAWVAPKKVWTVPVSKDALATIRALAGRYGWQASAETWAAAEQVVTGKAANVVASKAADADVALVGLGDGVTPYPYQRAGIAYSMRQRRVLIADEMGLGKTPQALLTVAQIDAFPALVVVPKSVVRQWAHETRKFLKGRMASIVGLKGNAKRLARQGLVAGFGGDVVIVNYERLNVLVDKIDVTPDSEPGKPAPKKRKYQWPVRPEAMPFRSLIIDESHYVKNSKVDRAQRVKALSRKDGLACTLLLTGTPVLNRPIELPSQLDILGRLEEFGGFMGFAKRYCAAHETKYGWDMSGSSNLDELNQLLRERCMVRREKKDVLAELPALQRTVVPVEIDDPKVYEQAMDDIVRWMAGQRGELPSEAAYRAEMLVRIEGLRQLAVKSKYESTRDWLANWMDTAEGEKLVVFAHHRDIQEKLKADLAAYGAVSISGGDSDDNRDAAVKRFWDDPTCRVIICSIKAASVGLNLQCASNVAFVEFAWHAADMDQAEARCHRIGVQGAVTAYWLVGEDTFDEDMVALIESKRAVAHAAVSGGEIEKQADVVAWFERLIERKRTKEAWEGN
jgi:SWI/SNF-related matrix-associated actin-dependent regulator 1 of chromatin subfamily A